MMQELIPKKRRDTRGANRKKGNRYPATLRLRPIDSLGTRIGEFVGAGDQSVTRIALHLYHMLKPKSNGFVQKSVWTEAVNVRVSMIEGKSWSGAHRLFTRLLDAKYLEIDPTSQHTVR